MVGTIILTFVITALSMTVLFLLDDRTKQIANNDYILKENDELRRQISDYRQNSQRRRERTAYDRGLYDGRATDTYYRQCLKKFTDRNQAEVMMNGESEE